jgi:hypothetical protein
LGQGCGQHGKLPENTDKEERQQPAYLSILPSKANDETHQQEGVYRYEDWRYKDAGLR